MKSIFTVFLVFSISIMSAQSIKGIVVDKNNEPIVGATVYFDGSSYGTTTDSDGEFKITIPSEISSSLIISFVGYEKAYFKNLNFDNRYRIILQESTENLKEVTLTNNHFSREQMLIVFRNQFLGATKSANLCTIVNLDEIYFSYDNDKFILTAYADEPLIIENPYLGYTVYFDLARFDTKFKSFSIKLHDIYSSVYVGTSRFEATENSTKIEKRRYSAFEGSITHFMRELSANNFSNKGFQLYDKKLASDSKNHFIIKDTLDLKKITVIPSKNNFQQKFKTELNILYNKKEQTKVIFLQPIFFIDKFGIFSNYENIHFSGFMTQKRVGDMLPTNYGIE